MGLNTRFPSVMFYTVPQISHNLCWRIAETEKKKKNKKKKKKNKFAMIRVCVLF